MSSANILIRTFLWKMSIGIFLYVKKILTRKWVGLCLFRIGMLYELGK
jgi:hypothetical protein